MGNASSHTAMTQNESLSRSNVRQIEMSTYVLKAHLKLTLALANCHSMDQELFVFIQ